MTPLEYAQSKAVASILKKRFPNLTTDECLALTFDILIAMQKVADFGEDKHE